MAVVVTGGQRNDGAMLDRVLGELELPPRTADWREDVEALLRALWETMKAHPWLAAAMSMTRPSVMPGAMPMSEHLLGERLTLPAAPTWWCGEAAVRGEALSMLDDCVIKPTYPSPYPGTAAREHFDPVLTRWLGESA